MPRSESISRLSTALIALLIATLVWVFAEGESVSTRTVMTSVNFPTEPVGDVLIRPDDPSFLGTARVRLEGTTRSIDAAATIVVSAGNRVRLTPGMAGVPSTPGRQGTVDLREALSSIPELRGLGSAVAEVDPRTVTVQVIRLAKRELPVRADVGTAVVLDGEPTCTPSTVTLRLSESELSRIPEGAFATAVISDQDLRKLRADEPQIVTASVRLPRECEGIDPIFTSPEQVAVTLRLKHTVDTLSIPTVPVWFSLPPSEDAGKWVVELEDKFIKDVTLSGPSEQLERVRSGKWAVKATIEISSDDLAKGVRSKQAMFAELPPGVSAATGDRVVRLKISKRTGAP